MLETDTTADLPSRKHPPFALERHAIVLIVPRH
jgi:hypothetical protein